MSFTEKEKREWHEARKANRGYSEQEVTVACAHCGAPAPRSEAGSDFPLCLACDD